MVDLDNFFTQELPAAFTAGLTHLEEVASQSTDPEKAARLQSKLEGIRAVEATMRFELTGDNRRDFYFNQKAGRLAVTGAPDRHPVAWISQELDDFQTLFALGASLVGGGDDGGAARLGRPLPKTLIDQVGSMDSVLRLVLTDLPDGRDVATVVRLGPSARRDDPDMSLTLTYDTLGQLRSGQINPPQAFMTGLLRIEGDMSIAMRLASLGM